MFDEVLQYYNENVLDVFLGARDALRDLKAGKSRDLKALLAAATSLFHYREHLPKSIRPSRADTEASCPDYGLLADIANASKHAEISNPTPHGPPYLNHASQIQEQLWSVEYADAEGDYRNSVKVVVVNLSSGGERQLLEVLTNVINYWEEFNVVHLISTLPPRKFLYERPDRLFSRADCNMGRADFEIVAGRRFTHNLRIMRYNAALGKAEPVDLTGSDFRMNFYRPRVEVELCITDEESGREYKETIELLGAHAMKVEAIADEAEKMQYVLALAVGKAAMRRMLEQGEQDRACAALKKNA